MDILSFESDNFKPLKYAFLRVEIVFLSLVERKLRLVVGILSIKIDILVV